MTHNDLVRRAERWLRNTRRCWVVLTGRGKGMEIADAIGWRASHSILVECKASRADFLADLKKPHRKVPELGMGYERWYLATNGLLTPDEIPSGWGLLAAHGRVIRIIKPWPATVADGRKERALRAELSLLVSEVGRYQMYGLTYPSSGDPSQSVEAGTLAAICVEKGYADAAAALTREAAHAYYIWHGRGGHCEIDEAVSDCA